MALLYRFAAKRRAAHKGDPSRFRDSPVLASKARTTDDYRLPRRKRIDPRPVETSISCELDHLLLFLTMRRRCPFAGLAEVSHEPTRSGANTCR